MRPFLAKYTFRLLFLLACLFCLVGTVSDASAQEKASYAWGANGERQLGNGTTVFRRSIAFAVSNSAGVVQVAAGTDHSLLLKADGTVWAFGNNQYGELGDGTIVKRTLPVQVSDLTGVVQIAAGYRYSLALKSDGTVWAWGETQVGELGTAVMSTKKHLCESLGYRQCSRLVLE